MSALERNSRRLQSGRSRVTAADAEFVYVIVDRSGLVKLCRLARVCPTEIDDPPSQTMARLNHSLQSLWFRSGRSLPSCSDVFRAMTKTRWYQDGLRFTCTQCGKCCSGEPGYVWVDDSEIRTMAESLQLSVDAFEAKFIRKVGAQKSLREYPDGDCILLDPEQRHCLVYKARPIQCRTWPFWGSNLKNEQTWRETCEECPGAGTGQLYTFEEIETERRRKDV